MKLSELAKKPTLVKLTVDRKDLVEKYGEELEFWMYDRQPLHVFSKIANSGKDADIGQYLEILSETILDEEGKAIMNDEAMLPIDLMTECMKLIGERLGK